MCFFAIDLSRHLIQDSQNLLMVPLNGILERSGGSLTPHGFAQSRLEQKGHLFGQGLRLRRMVENEAVDPVGDDPAAPLN